MERQPRGHLRVSKLQCVLPGLLFLVLSLAPAPQAASQEFPFTLDFETGDLRGWTKTGNAFDFQPTLDDNPTARKRGQPSNHQGRYWIGTYERYQAKLRQKPGSIQGDEPTGTLTSAVFTIPRGTLSFLVGGGAQEETRVELLIIGDTGGLTHSRLSASRVPTRVLSASGRNSETMRRVTWDLDPYAGRKGALRIVDAASGWWGHINADDFRFEARSSGPAEETPARPQARIEPPALKVTQGEKTVFESRSTHDQRVALVRQDWTGPGNRRGEGRSFVIATDDLTPGTYEIGLTVVDDREQVDKASARLDVAARTVSYRLMLQASPERVNVNQQVRFRARLDPPHENAEYLFSFGDWDVQSRTGSPEAEHRYRSAGTFSAVVAAQLAGRTVAESQPVSIIVDKHVESVPEQTKAKISPERVRLQQGEDAVFEGLVSHDPEVRLVREDWTGPGGSRGRGRRFSIPTGSLQPGTYEISLIALDDRGQGDRALAVLEVLPRAAGPDEPVLPRSLSLAANPQTPKEGAAVLFTVTASPPDNRTEYRILFGDGAEQGWSSARSGEHVYGKAGSYNAIALARIGDQVVESGPVLVTVERQQSAEKLPWVEIAAGLLIAGGYYLISRIRKARREKMQARPALSIRTVTDSGEQDVEERAVSMSSPAIGLKPEPDPGEQTIGNADAIIEGERREHG